MSRSFAMTMVVTMGLPVTTVAQQSTIEQESIRLNQPRTQQESTVDPTERREANYRGDQPGQNQPGQQANEELVNFLAAKLMLANQCEIEAANMAAQRAESPEVKTLANKIQQSHELLNQQLKQAMPGLKTVEGLSNASTDRTRRAVASNPGGERLGEPVDRLNGRTDRSRLEAGNQNSTDAQTRNQNAGRDAQRGGSQSDQFLDGAAQTLIDINRRAVENNHEMVKRELGEKQGAEFDRCFVNQQVGAHMWMLSELEAIQDVGPTQFTSLVKESKQQVKSHLDAAKQLAKKLEQQAKDSQAGAQTAPRNRVTEF